MSINYLSHLIIYLKYLFPMVQDKWIWTISYCRWDCAIYRNTDDLHIFPSKKFEIKNNTIKTDFDHRIAMAFAVMGSKIGPLNIKESNSINTSFPSFVNEFNTIGGKISWKK